MKQINFKSLNNLNRLSNNLIQNNNDTTFSKNEDIGNESVNFGQANLDMNSFFYSKCNDRYKKIKEKIIVWRIVNSFILIVSSAFC